jgi:lipoprotein-anchoring transpeptidase ErfK/SrfK
MSRTATPNARTASRWGLATVSIGVLVTLIVNTAAAVDSSAAIAADPGPVVATTVVPAPGATATPGTTPSTGSTAPAPDPSASPTPPPTPPKPADPLAGLSRKAKARFRPCLPKAVGPHASGSCAQLLQKSLKTAGFYPWGISGQLNVAGVNAVLNYQRSRGIKPTGVAGRATWIALATKAAALPVVLPKVCYSKGIVICVDQGHRRLFWMKDGKVVKVVKVRVGGYNVHPKTGKWRVFPTANGTWRVYDKQVDPKSENYGSGAMPYSTMFYPDMYVHYSPGFHSVGYAGSSHGCVNVGSLADAIWIFRHTPIGTRVRIFTPSA